MEKFNINRELWNNNKRFNIFTFGVAEVEEKHCGSEKIFEEILAENIPNLAKGIKLHSERLINPKQDKPKEVHVKVHHNQTSEN